MLLSASLDNWSAVIQRSGETVAPRLMDSIQEEENITEKGLKWEKVWSNEIFFGGVGKKVLSGMVKEN